MVQEKDVSVIRELRRNARTGITKMSALTKMPKSTVFDKLRKLEKGVITKHTSIVDFRKLGFASRHLFIVKSNPDRREHARAFLSQHPAVNNLYLTDSGFDFLFEAVFRNNKEMDDFKKELESENIIQIIKNHEMIEDIIREKFMEE